MKTLSQILISFSIIMFSSCEGFKTLNIKNDTDKEVTIQTYGYDLRKTAESGQTWNSYPLKPGSDTIIFVTSITGMMFNAGKLSASELSISQLYIASDTDTIRAASKTAIILMIENKEVRQGKLKVQTQNRRMIIKEQR